MPKTKLGLAVCGSFCTFVNAGNVMTENAGEK